MYTQDGASNYNALQLAINRRFSKRFQLGGNYTWSKTIGLGDSALDAEGVADVYNQRLERSIINYNYPHVAKLSWVYELPISYNKLVKLNKITDKFPSADAAYQKIKELDAAKGIVWLNMSPVNNTYAFAMNRDDAQKRGIVKSGRPKQKTPCSAPLSAVRNSCGISRRRLPSSCFS